MLLCHSMYALPVEKTFICTCNRWTLLAISIITGVTSALHVIEGACLNFSLWTLKPEEVGKLLYYQYSYMQPSFVTLSLFCHRCNLVKFMAHVETKNSNASISTASFSLGNKSISSIQLLFYINQILQMSMLFFYGFKSLISYVDATLISEGSEYNGNGRLEPTT